MHTPFPETARKTNYFYFVSAVLGIPFRPGFMRAGEKGFNNEDFQILCMIMRLKLTTD
jgi:hypothetical protein